ncbi:hypothetical protein SUGI_0247330 [Cryptomeria japonica]|nr:hypothetical protein SUGI_0247330 [Cryptomeria japonica]
MALLLRWRVACVEAQLVKTLVNEVIKIFNRVPLDVAKHPVGLKSLTNHLIHKFILNSEEGVIKAGLVGIGGIGKTTLAKAMYNRVSSKFDATSFVFNVRATAAEGRDLPKLQKKILEDLIKYDGKVDSVDEGITLFKDRLGRKRVLLILDDVDSMEQSNALVGNWLGPGSRVIITTRDAQIFHLAKISSEWIHEMSGLQLNEGLQLFSWHAFLRASPITTHEDLSNRIVEACKGHPLSLEVIGSFLYEQKNPDCWTETLHNITQHPEIHDRLKISYNALSADEKEIFLDIACFFIGEDKYFPIVFWKPLCRMVESAIHSLSLKLLVRIDDNGVFDMHDHLRDMGRNIAERERTRLWKAVDLRTISNDNNFSRLQLNGGNPPRPETSYGSALRFLHLEDVPIDGTTRAMLSPTLIWLRLQNCQKPFQFSNFCRSLIQRPFRFSLVHRISDLRIMQVHGDIYSFQHSLSKILGNLSQLQHLELRYYKNLNSLHSIGNLSMLQCLDLEWCTNLKKLSSTIGTLSQLQILKLRYCKKLNKLLDKIGHMSKLQHLDLEGCTKLNKLPQTIGNLSQLQYLNLKGCKKLNKLPDSIGNLSELRHLDLRWCEDLNNLPETIGSLSQLQYLDFAMCEKLNSLPDSIGSLSQLKHLDLAGCANLNKLPDSIGNLSRLKHLNLHWCKKLNNLPDSMGNLSQLQDLDLRECENLNNIPDSIQSLSNHGLRIEGTL